MILKVAPKTVPERTFISVFADPLPEGVEVFEVPIKAKTAPTGRKPFTAETVMRAYEVELRGQVIGEFHAYPVQTVDDVIAIEWAARLSLFNPPSTYKGGFSTREAAIKFILLQFDLQTRSTFEPAVCRAPIVKKRYTLLIKKNKAGEFAAYFQFNGENIFWSEGYASAASARNAVNTLIQGISNSDYTLREEI